MVALGKSLLRCLSHMRLSARLIPKSLTASVLVIGEEFIIKVKLLLSDALQAIVRFSDFVGWIESSHSFDQASANLKADSSWRHSSFDKGSYVNFLLFIL